ncbi:MAG: glutamine synthetase family protein [Candidatus Thorarchaeota archaeon]
MANEIKYIELRIADILGRLKAMIVPCTPVDSLEEVRKDPILAIGTSIDGSSILGLSNVESSDLRLDPDPSTLIELPYTLQRTAAAMCFIRERIDSSTSEEYYSKDSRGLLHEICETHLTDGDELRVKVEPEFHFVTTEGEPFDYGAYADTFPINSGAEILLEISNAIREIGMVPRVIHHEVGYAQQEIEIDYEDVRKMADTIMVFKNLSRAIAEENGLEITFMPKPFAGGAGNGLHCHLQLWKGDTNLFGGKNPNELSETGKKFIAGILDHASAITAIANPTVNSYKRLVPHHEAPVYISWGMKNRTTLVRVPLFNSKDKAAVEFRSPDPTTNPYLLFSALVVAGMDGIKQNLTPPEPIDGNVFNMTSEEREKLGIKSLPSNLSEALDCLEKDQVIRESIGGELLDTYIELKRTEWRNYINEAVTDWEWEAYFGL